MKTQIVNVVVKAAPYAKKFLPIAIAGLGGVMEAISEQKVANQMANMEKRIADLENLLNNK